MPVYRYYCCFRVPCDSDRERTVPKNSVGTRVWGSRPFVHEAGCTVFGTVDYDQPLSKGEMAFYGLAPANVVQQPIQIAV